MLRDSFVQDGTHGKRNSIFGRNRRNDPFPIYKIAIILDYIKGFQDGGQIASRNVG